MRKVQTSNQTNRHERLHRLGVIFSSYCFLSIALDCLVTHSYSMIIIGLPLGFVGCVCLFADDNIKKNHGNISPRLSATITIFGWLAGVAILLATLPANQSCDSYLLSRFVIYFFAPLSFAANLPAITLYSKLSESKNILCSAVAVILPLAGLGYSIYDNYNNLMQLMPAVIIFCPAVVLVGLLQLLAWKRNRPVKVKAAAPEYSTQYWQYKKK